MSYTGDGARSGHAGEPVLVAAGIAGLAFSGIGTALQRAGELLSRSGLAELAQDGRGELRQRGRLALRRYAPASESHMELPTRRAASRPGQSDV
ncbi:hypothetical protein A6A08_24855 [Nocardiopsis sp. TSRI0078]|uniref:hypothetical protein n=1 Tax=unclassified Nocardiopsis TaxID=2649073 RepID=UPI00094020A5|nr:hypothetical protein [Nocardiopsis sp. TSRI0078]OKI18397.1 hypothetical protein A6A08_24855 [Nocardiopsis sp. TSRI0078]